MGDATAPMLDELERHEFTDLSTVDTYGNESEVVGCTCGKWAEDANREDCYRLWWEHALAAASPVGTLGDDERCRRCGGENVVWCAPSPLWNRVMRYNDINAETRFNDLVCIRCFIVLAAEAGVQGHQWHLYLDPEPEGLIKVTPSGRVWDGDRWLWVEPLSSEEAAGRG